MPILSELLWRTKTYNVALLFNSTSPFSATVWRLGITGLELFEDRVVDTLLTASDIRIYFYDVTKVGEVESLDPAYVLQAHTEFDGSSAITYDSSNYVLYMVNRSGIYAWDPGWIVVTSECRSVGAGARIELVDGRIVVLPGSPADYVCVCDIASGTASNVPLPQRYRLYQYTSSAVVADSVVFTALDESERVSLLMFNTTSMQVGQLGSVPSYCVAGLATNGLRAYAVLCGLWSSATNFDNVKGIGVWVCDLRTGLSRVVVIANSSHVKLLGYSDRVEVYDRVLLVVDEDRIHTIDLKNIPLIRDVPLYAP